ncbi:MAG: MORN repeat-containing protein, partial [Trichodesmium erythraeum GBRTRLIN201]|nr:MORN repeat-containing protein [Trichodesmium erythraeum GBRTRLIN201]
GEKYVGEFKDGKMNGRGTAMDSNELLENQQNVAKIDTFCLFYDVETTGLPRNLKAPVSDLNNRFWLKKLKFIHFMMISPISRMINRAKDLNTDDFDFGRSCNLSP